MLIHIKSKENREKGAVNLMLALATAGAVLLSGALLLKRGDLMMSDAEIKTMSQLARSEAKKLMAIPGFLVATNLLVCREETFPNGNLCQWNPSGGDGNFEMETFGLGSTSYQDNNETITFQITPSKLKFGRDPKFKIIAGTLDFTLVDVRDYGKLDSFVGERDEATKQIDRDFSVILATVKIRYTTKRGEKKAKYQAVFRRPIAVVNTSIDTNPTCASQCRSSVSVNPTPSCRGPQDLNSASVVNISVTSTNLGPGALYRLAYEKGICYNENINSPGCTPLESSLSSKKIPIADGIIMPGESITWTDQVECLQFAQTTNNPGSANAPQHISNAGQIAYKLSATSDFSDLEPFRMGIDVDVNATSFPGLLNLIYVAPTH